MSTSSRSAGGGQDGGIGDGTRAPVGDATLPESAGLGMAATLASGGAGPTSLPVVTTAAFPVPNWDRYEFIATLGRGGMGSVYKARDRRLGRIVALKFIHGDDPGLIQRFLQEARAQARLTSPHICQIHEAGFVDNKPYIAMEFVDGASLDKAGPALSLVEKVQLMRDVARAMHLAHEEGIIHRDLKPSNIMLERLGGGRLRPVIMDFGLARDSDTSASQGLTESGAVIGTPAYMSPEQARGEARRLDRRSDVYSLGATLYDLLSGKPPFQDETVVNLLLKVVSEPPTPLRSRLPDLPEAIDLIVSKCLNKEAEQRYPTALALADDLDRYLLAGRVLARRLGYLYRLRYFARRNPALAAVGAALIVAAIALLVVGVRSRLVALRKDREAREQAALAQTLGQSVKDLEWLVRTAYLLPLHSTAYEKGLVRSRMANISQELSRAGESGARLGAYVLGRGHLALHEWDQAFEQLRRAEQLGYRDTGLDFALGRVLGEKYSRALDEARKSGDKSFVEKRKKELETEFLIPARTYLVRSRGQASETPNYVEALLDFYNEHYDAALLNAHMARKQAPWLYEALKLEGDVHLVRALAQRDHGDSDAAERSFSSAVARYEAAAAIGHSDPQVHEALAEAWIRQEEMDLYRGVDPAPKMQKALAAAQAAIESDPDASHGHTKLAFSLSFIAQHALRMGDTKSALSFAERQATEAQLATQLHPKDPYAYDCLGNAYRMISELNLIDRHNIELTLSKAYQAFERSLEIQPQFPWALNDHAGTLLVDAQSQVLRNIDPSQTVARLTERTQQAIALDPQYVQPRMTRLGGLVSASSWQSERGLSPEPELKQALTIAAEAEKTHPGFPPIDWNVSMILQNVQRYQVDRRQDDEDTRAQLQRRVQQVLKTFAGAPDAQVLAAESCLLGAQSRLGPTEPARKEVAAGLAHVAECYARQAEYPDCQAIESQLRLYSLLYNNRNNAQIKSEIDRVWKLIHKISNESNKNERIFLVCAEVALETARLMGQRQQAEYGQRIRDGLSCAQHALKYAINWPRALAFAASLQTLQSQVARSPSEAAQLREQARQSFQKAFAGNPLLRGRFGPLADGLEPSAKKL